MSIAARRHESGCPVISGREMFQELEVANRKVDELLERFLDSVRKGDSLRQERVLAEARLARAEAARIYEESFRECDCRRR